MPATISEQTVHALEIIREEDIAAPINVVFETVLEQMGPANQAPGTGLNARTCRSISSAVRDQSIRASALSIFAA